MVGKIAVGKIDTLHLARLRTRMQERGNIQSSIQQVAALLVLSDRLALDDGYLQAEAPAAYLDFIRRETAP
ncbi:hypothetical protein [Nannocystis exedens]|nr:hypothetical protein [Nannocystis exedens]